MPEIYSSTIHQNEQFKFLKTPNKGNTNASSSKHMGNQATSFPPGPGKTAENQGMCISKLLKFYENQAGF